VSRKHRQVEEVDDSEEGKAPAQTGAGTCPLCEREVPANLLQAHHLQTRRKDRFDTERICAPCHVQVHALFTNNELRDERRGLDTVEGLLADERMARAVAFIRKQPPESRVTTRQSRRTRGR